MRPAKDASTTPNRGTVQTAKISNTSFAVYRSTRYQVPAETEQIRTRIVENSNQNHVL